MASCAFSKNYFTHTVFPLCVHPATKHVKGVAKLYAQQIRQLIGFLLIHEHCSHDASCWIFVRILLHKCYTHKTCYLFQSQSLNVVLPFFLLLLPCSLLLLSCSLLLLLCSFLLLHCSRLPFPCSLLISFAYSFLLVAPSLLCLAPPLLRIPPPLLPFTPLSPC